MTTKQFIDKYNGKKVDWDGAYGAQCVDLFRFFNNEVLEISQPKGVNGAKDFWSNYASDPNLYNNFDKISNTADFIPKEGDVMIWTGHYGPYGHIAIVSDNKADLNRFRTLSQNDPSGRESHIKEYSYKSVYGVLRPKNLPTDNPEPIPDEPSDDILDFLNAGNSDEAKKKLIEHLGQKDNKCHWGADRGAGYLGQAREDVKRLTEENAKLKEENSDLRGEKTSFETRAKDSEKKHNDFVSQLAQKLGSEGTESVILGEVERLITSESDTQKQVKTLQSAMEDQRRKYEDEISSLKKSFETQNSKLEEMIVQNKRLIGRVEELEEQKETTKRINQIIANFINLFKKGK